MLHDCFIFRNCATITTIYSHIDYIIYRSDVEVEQKMIAFICPISKPESEIRKRSDFIMDNVLNPVAEVLGYYIQRADKLTGSVIMDDIITMLHKAAIVVADLTEMNPNVLYELGLRQATKGKCINIICDNGKDELPFDISYYRALMYKTTLSNYTETMAFQQQIRDSILYLESAPWDPKMPLTTRDLTNVHKITVVEDFLTGEKNHYNAAKRLFNTPCKCIFLMQRSSSIILNAEQGWGEEEEFLQRLKSAIEICGVFYHILTIEGIEAHLQRSNSVFPHFKDFSNNVENNNGCVAIKTRGSEIEKTFYLKKLPKDSHDSLFKLDRQSRVLITEDIAGNVTAVVVQNLGTDQTCFLIQGPKAKEYLNACINYYSECELVRWQEIEDLYENYSKERGSDTISSE